MKKGDWNRPIVRGARGENLKISNLKIGDSVKLFLLGGRYGLGELIFINKDWLKIQNKLSGNTEKINLRKVILIQIKTSGG